MNGRIDAERILDAFLAPESDRLPDRVIDAALADIARTPQRRALRVSWRFPTMPALSRAAGIAAVALVAVVGAGSLFYLTSNRPGEGGTTPPPATLAPSAAPTNGPTAAPTQAVYVPPALSETFTSRVHGITVSYPAGWNARMATEPWTTTDTLPVFTEPTGDILDDPRLQDHLFLTLVSQPLGDRSFDAWSTALLEPCTETEPIVVDGADGLRCGLLAVASTGGRGYVIILRKSDDDAELRAFDATDWFNEVLATVQLEPVEAVDG